MSIPRTLPFPVESGLRFLREERHAVRTRLGTMNWLRRCEYVPPMPESDARHLRGLPASWQQPIAESALEGLHGRAMALASRLQRCGRKHEADELRRRAALLARADELHRHASDVETAVGLYRALSTLAGEQEHLGECGRTWAQAGALEEPMAAHGPAFRETAALRNRAYRSLAAAVARHVRAHNL
jgi:hypothetical protein